MCQGGLSDSATPVQRQDTDAHKFQGMVSRMSLQPSSNQITSMASEFIWSLIDSFLVAPCRRKDRQLLWRAHSRSRCVCSALPWSCCICTFQWGWPHQRCFALQHRGTVPCFAKYQRNTVQQMHLVWPGLDGLTVRCHVHLPVGPWTPPPLPPTALKIWFLAAHTILNNFVWKKKNCTQHFFFLSWHFCHFASFTFQIMVKKIFTP